MPRKALGDRPLTPAERQAHQRQKRALARKDLAAAIQDVLDAVRLSQAHTAARRALEALRRL